MRHAPIAGGRSRWIVMCVIFSFCGSVLAQPPIVVDWIQDQVLWYNGNGLHLNPVNGTTLLDISGTLPWLEPGCSTNRISIYFSPTGEPLTSIHGFGCMDVYGIVQQFTSVILTPAGSTIYATLNVSNSPYVSTGVMGVFNYGPGWVEPITLSPESGGGLAIGLVGRHALLAAGNMVFIGGETRDFPSNSLQCPNVIWRYPYPNASSGPSWRTCVDPNASTLFKTFDLWNDTLLAVGFPKVIKVDTVSGMPMGSFDLFNGPTMNNGHTCVSGDTLYWASQFGASQMHVGKYLMNSGPIWDVALPYNGSPVELHIDGYNRLWTAVGNTILWIDPADGSYQSYEFGLSVRALDMVGNSVAISGTTDGVTSYVLKAHVVP